MILLKSYFIWCSLLFCVILSATEHEIAELQIATANNYCEYYNKTCNSFGRPGCKGVEQCTALMDGEQRPCYVLWSLDINGAARVALKGCYLGIPDCNQTKCVSRRHNPKNKILFCCCTGNLCNTLFN